MYKLVCVFKILSKKRETKILNLKQICKQNKEFFGTLRHLGHETSRYLNYAKGGYKMLYCTG
jgi:hypothetical protein